MLQPSFCSCTKVFPTVCRGSSHAPSHLDGPPHQEWRWPQRQFHRPNGPNAYNLEGCLAFFFSRKAFRPTSFFKKNESFGNQIVGVIFQERHQEVNRESNCCLSFPLHASWVWFVKNWFVKTSKSTVRSGSNPITRQIGDSPWSSTKCSHVMILRALPFADLNKQSRRKNSWENG